MSQNGPDDLGDRIAQAKATREAREAKLKRDQASSDGTVSAGAHALRYGAEFGASVFVGGLIGYWIDVFAGTKPWGLLIMGAFGFAAGIRAIVRAYKELNARALEEAEGQKAPYDRTTET